jgi:transposase
MREMSLSEQRTKAILAVIADGRTVSEVAKDWGVCRRTMHRWLERYEGEGLEGARRRCATPWPSGGTRCAAVFWTNSVDVDV